MTKTSSIVLTVIVVIFVVLAGWLLWGPSLGGPTPPAATSSSTTIGSSSAQIMTFDQTMSDGTITFSYPSADFGLATTKAQILAKAYIPPCDESFKYCLYYNGTAYKGTNFESAGLRITKRADLTTAAQCLATPPAGYTNLTPITASSSDYAAGTFPAVGNAGAGHYASGNIYRLAYAGTCYELETRIGQTQFANYPSGTIQQFTTDDQTAVQNELQQILATVSLPSGETVTFPSAQH